MRMKDGMPAGWGPAPTITLVRPAVGQSLQPRVARLALDNCSEIQRRFIHSLGALFSTNPRTFEDVLAGRVYLTARPDGNVATLRPSPL